MAHTPRSDARLVARGAADNPKNRFERLFVETDEDAAELDPDAEGAPPLRTIFYRDPSRTLLATNQSPDIPFETSLNPYRGCEHGCAYCLGPHTPILHADLTWRPIGDVRVGDALIGFDEHPALGRTRKLQPAVVEHVWWSRKPTLRLITGESDIVTTEEHRWLQARDFRWSKTIQLDTGKLLRRLPVVEPEPIDQDYRVGYVSGLSLGDGTFRFEPGWRSDKLGFPAAYWRVAMADQEPLLRAASYLARFGIEVCVRPFQGSSRRPMQKVETRSLAKLAILHRLLSAEIESPGYRRGFVAGFFDAEGHNGTSLRMFQVDTCVLERVRRYAAEFGFQFRLERSGSKKARSLRLVGTDAERMRFFSVFVPAIERKKHQLFGRTPATVPERVEKVEPGPVADVVDIQTSTGTFYADGIATHNCYARPTHEYLGFSAGLDFESRILVKQDAPELLRRSLASPRWKPQVVALSGVTDPYQPAERRLRLTRRCLEVFLDFRNPVAIVTKNALVTRDADLLAALARFDAAVVNVSITTLDDALRRKLEPRASSPRARLAAVEALAAARVPVGVMVAPIIPGLNDHEVPAIVEAAARAGARRAAPVVLRLPHGVAPLFESWLARHAPERKDKVMNRVRAMRGGRTNDPRFGSRMRGEGVFAEQIQQLFALACRRAGLSAEALPLSTASFRRPGGEQLSMI